MSKIKKVVAREVLDSRGNPTVKVDVVTENYGASAIVPSGASTGKHEALELRDGDKARYDGKGVLKAVDNVNKIISKKLVGLNCENQKKIDELMIKLDGTENKSKLGGNAIIGVSMAVCKAGAFQNNMHLFDYVKKISGSKKLSLPVPQLNVINSGKHAGMENDIQEHMIMPVKFKTFNEALRAGVDVYHELGKLLKEKFGSQGILLGDEGGFVPKIDIAEKRLELIDEAINNTGYKNKIFMALDCAASEFFYSDYYKIREKEYSPGELIDFYKSLIKKYRIISIEDGMAEDDWNGWRLMSDRFGENLQLVGDDIFVTNTEILKEGIEKNIANSILIKVNQIGSLTETIATINMAKEAGYTVIISHRSGETEDTTIADLAVATSAGQIKTGSLSRSDRVAKYNRLMKIEDQLGDRASYPGKDIFYNLK
ncbi:MAG: phosphopyruvate hydratase [Proteobacteria bacterium]|nr:phosphopyruvate hydratase [Pseudomonadota bacterium]